MPVGSLLTVIVGVLIFTVLLVTHGDPDLWGHVRYGQDFLKTWSLPSIDPYSFTQDRPWVNHEWLSEAFMAAAYQLAGNAGLIALKVLVLGTGIVVVGWYLPSSPLLVREGLLVLLTWASLPLTNTMRPQIWTFVLLPLLLVALRRPRRQWIVPLILASWANLHGGWLVGFGVVWMWAVGEAIEGRRGELRVALVSTLATLVTPYGWGLWRFLGETVRLGRSDITEWQPFATLPTYHFVPFVLLVCWVAWRRPRRLGSWIILTALTVATWRVARLGPLWAICAALLSALDRQEASAVAPRMALNRTAIIPMAIALPVVFAAAIAAMGPAVGCLRSGDEWAADPRIMQALKGRTGRLANEFNWGQYALWHLGPELRVSIDGRRETIYSDRTIALQNALARGEADGVRWLKETQPEYLWFGASRDALKTAALNTGYRVDVDGFGGFLAVRGDLPAVRVSTQAPGRCFP